MDARVAQQVKESTDWQLFLGLWVYCSLSAGRLWEILNPKRKRKAKPVQKDKLMTRLSLT